MSLTTTGTYQAVPVGLNPLRVHGAANWTGENEESQVSRSVEITNCSPTGNLYIKRVLAGSALPGSVSSTQFSAKIAGMVGPVVVWLGAGEDLVVVADAANTLAFASSILEIES